MFSAVSISVLMKSFVGKGAQIYHSEDHAMPYQALHWAFQRTIPSPGFGPPA
jgi:hypothetical protein